MKAAAFAFAALLAASPARAEDQAAALYAAGKYDEAMKAGAAEATAPALLSPRAPRWPTPRRATCPVLPVSGARKDFARHAVAADPALADGAVLARRCRWATRRGSSGRVHRARAQLSRPCEGRARRGARGRSEKSLGARRAWRLECRNRPRRRRHARQSVLRRQRSTQGLDSFSRAFRAAPDNLALRYQYALSLSGYDPDRFRHEIDDAFARVARDMPQSAYERVVQKRAADLAALLKSGDRAAFAARVRKYQGYPS